MQLKDIMTRDVQVIGPEATLTEAARVMKQMDVGSVPVCDGRRIQGIITDRDIALRAVAEGKDPNATRVSDVMTPDIVYGTADQSVEDAAHVMEQHQIRRLVVLDDNKDLVGVVSLGDLALEARDRSLSAEALEAISEPGHASIGSIGNAGNVGGVGAGNRSTAATSTTTATTATAASSGSGVGARTRPGEV